MAIAVTVIPAARGWGSHPEGSLGFREVGTLDFPANTVTGGALQQYSSSLVLDVPNRRAYALIGGSPTDNARKPKVIAYDLDDRNFREINRRTLDGANAVDLAFNRAPENATGLLVTQSPTHLYVKQVTGSKVAVIAKSDLTRTALWPGPLPSDRSSVEENPTDPGRALASYRLATIGGMVYLPPAGGLEQGKILVLTETAYIGSAVETPNMVTLHQWDALTGKGDWALRTSACSAARGPQASKYGMAPTISVDPVTNRRELAFGCVGRSNRGEVWRIPLKDDGSVPDEQVLAGAVPLASDFYIDPLGRSALVQTSSHQGQTFVGVDLDRRGAYGQFASSVKIYTHASEGDIVSAGLDPATGRVYALAPPSTAGANREPLPGGLQIVDARRRPLPVGDAPFTFHELGDVPPTAGSTEIVVDPATAARPARVFVRFANEFKIRIYEDTIPLSKDTPFGEPDKYTHDLVEASGKAQGSPTASTNGYGARFLVVGGAFGAIPSATSSGGGTYPRDFLKPAEGGLSADPGIPCEAPNREVVLASIPHPGTTLSDAGTTATAEPAAIDPKTLQDLRNPAGACWPTRTVLDNFNLSAVENLLKNVTNPAEDILGSPLPDPKAPLTQAPDEDIVADDGDGQDESDLDEGWGGVLPNPVPFGSATCSAPGQSTATPDDDPESDDDIIVQVRGNRRSFGPPPGFMAKVRCAAGGRGIDAVSRAGRGFGLGDITIDGADISTRIQWPKTGGTLIETIARARGVDVAGIFTVGELRSRAVSAAAGRKGSAAAEYTRYWCGLSAGSVTVPGCFDADGAEVQAFVTNLNERVLKSRGFEIRTPPLDPELVGGTPGGALAAVQKDRFTSVGERLLNNDIRTAVPAMEVLHINDTAYGRARQLYQFAAVEASTSYQVTPILDFDFDFDVDPGPFMVPEPPAAAIGEPSVRIIARPLALPTVTGEVPREAIPTRVLSTPASDGSADGPPGGAFVSGNPFQVIGSGLRWLLRNPAEALKVSLLIFAGFGLPLYLHDRRRATAAAVARKA
jgi:hypothetical protein